MHWLDLEWPPSLNKCLLRLWELYDNESNLRIKEGCDQAQARYKLEMEKQQLEEKNMELHIELGKALSASQGSSSSSPDNTVHVANILGLHKSARDKAEKKRGQMIEENKRLTVMKDMAEAQRDAFIEEKKAVDRAFNALFIAGENNKQKLKKIKEILDE